MPTLLDFNNHMTRGHGELEDSLRATHAGMAHFAGSGPAGKTCRECVFWTERNYYAKGGKYAGAIKPSSCERYHQLTGRQGEKVPHEAAACRHFEHHPSPPKVRDGGA